MTRRRGVYTRRARCGVELAGTGTTWGDMATRAERFRAKQERSGPKRPKKPATPPRSYDVDTSLPRVSASDRRHGGTSTAARNRSLGHKATYALDDAVAPKLPPRKSTRRSKHRQKAGTQQKAREELVVSSPSQRHLTKK
jgi:hypothetical protein